MMIMRSLVSYMRVYSMMLLLSHHTHLHTRGKDGLQAIGRTFAASNHLKQINLSRNQNIGNDGMATFATSIINDISSSSTMAALPSLETLILSDCNIGPLGMQSLAQVLTPSADDSTITRSQPINLTISSNPIGPDGCDTLSRLISIPSDEDEDGGSSSSVLSHLFMSQCSIGDEGLVNLLQSAASTTMDTLMGHFSGLTVLDVSDNSITKDGVKVLAGSLTRSWPDLVELKLAKNELEDEGVVALMTSLVTRSDKVDYSTEEEKEEKKNATLDNLDISCTNCGIEGAKAALMSGGLTTLRLFNNRLGSDGFYAIAPLLQGGHPSIENLDLGGNNADEDAVVALLNSIADNNTTAGTTINDGSNFTSTLSVLEIGGNKFGNDAMEALNRLKLVFPKLDMAHDKPIQEAEMGEGKSED